MVDQVILCSPFFPPLPFKHQQQTHQ